jgi:hypothetical protein
MMMMMMMMMGHRSAFFTIFRKDDGMAVDMVLPPPAAKVRSAKCDQRSRARNGKNDYGGNKFICGDPWR